MKKVKVARKGWIVGGVVVVVVVLVLLIFNLGFVGSVGVERSFSKNVVSPGESFTVSLDIRVADDGKYFLVEEGVPEGFVVDDRNARDNKVRLASIQDPESVVYTYEVTAPSESGEYVFSGEYGMESTDGIVPIEGATVLTVK